MTPSGRNLHWKTAWSAPPVLTTHWRSLDQRTLVTCAEWPMYFLNLAPGCKRTEPVQPVCRFFFAFLCTRHCAILGGTEMQLASYHVCQSATYTFQNFGTLCLNSVTYEIEEKT